MKKGIFPYTYFDCYEKLSETEFPPIEVFTNDLTDQKMNEAKYEEAKQLYIKLGFKSFYDWLILYQTLDVKLLMDVWVSFRDICVKYYNLDPGHFVGAPGLAFDAMLKLTKVNIELITDPDMFYFFEKQIRGGISTTGNTRYAKANTPLIPLTYDATIK